MKLLLVSKTPIVIQIFSLVCKKIDLELIVQNDNEVDEKYDLLVIDKEFIDDRFNIIKQYSKKLGAIVSEELPFEKARDFIIPRPFLPLQLQSILEEYVSIIKNEEKEELNSKKTNVNTTAHVVDYVESLADDIAMDIEDESDESIITLASLRDGGVLNNGELNKINDILHDDDIADEFQKLEEEDWLDLSEIIDRAIDDVKDYDFEQDLTQPIKVLLNNHNLDELKPLLTKLDQNIVDSLIAGNVIDLQLKLKDKIVD